jgi:hypothetical protein
MHGPGLDEVASALSATLGVPHWNGAEPVWLCPTLECTVTLRVRDGVCCIFVHGDNGADSPTFFVQVLTRAQCELVLAYLAERFAVRGPEAAAS